MSPHAFNEKKFIFFDYPNSIPISKEKFNLYWNIVEKKFNEWDFKISPVVNAHFHAYSDTNFDIFMNNEIQADATVIRPAVNIIIITIIKS